MSMALLWYRPRTNQDRYILVVLVWVPNHGKMWWIWLIFGTVFIQIKFGTIFGVLVWVPNHGGILSVWFNFSTVIIQIKMGTVLVVLVWFPNHREIWLVWLHFGTVFIQNQGHFLVFCFFVSVKRIGTNEKALALH